MTKSGVRAVHGGQRGEQLKKLLNFCSLLSTKIDQASLMDTVLRESGKVLDAEAASVLLYDRESDSLVFPGACGTKARELRRETLRREEGIAGCCFTTGRPVLVNDVSRDARFAVRIDRATGFTTRSLLAVPISVNEEMIGVLEFVNKRRAGGFDEEEIEIACSVAGIIACAIERTRLVRENIEKARLASIGETIAGLAHCINNILNGLKGGCFIIEGALGTEDCARIARGWAIIRRNIDTIGEMVADMLTYCRERRPQLATANMNGVIGDAVGLVRENARTQGTVIHLELSDSIPDFPFDPKGVRRCILNLLTNALDALSDTGDSGRVTVESRRRENEVYVIVKDNGSGMSEKTLRKAFISFFSTKGARGTGLGLPVSRKIIREHGGELDAWSREGEGTSFRIRLPLQPRGENGNG